METWAGLGVETGGGVLEAATFWATEASGWGDTERGNLVLRRSFSRALNPGFDIGLQQKHSLIVNSEVKLIVLGNPFGSEIKQRCVRWSSRTPSRSSEGYPEDKSKCAVDEAEVAT